MHGNACGVSLGRGGATRIRVEHAHARGQVRVLRARDAWLRHAGPE